MAAYFQEHPETKDRLYAEPQADDGEIRVGMLRFTPDTAVFWGGPFPGDTAHFSLRDDRIFLDPREAIPFAEALEEVKMQLVKRRPYIKTEMYLTWWERLQVGDPDTVHLLHEYGTVEYPYSLHVEGNDDTRYTRWFATLEDAEAFLALLEACDPLDFQRDFMEFDWTFTN